MRKLFLSGILLFGALVLAGCTSAPIAARTSIATPARPVRLQMTVAVPASMNILRQEDVSEAFAYRVSAALHEQGLRGRNQYVEQGDRSAPDVPMLNVMLHEWRVDELGNVDCTFTARLETPSGARDLGIFSGTSMMTWSRRNWMDRQRDFEDAAHDALTNLAQRISQTGLLPDAQLR